MAAVAKSWRREWWGIAMTRLVTGRIDDLVGRKYTFLVTIVVMGGNTAARWVPQRPRAAKGRRSSPSEES
jgi:hypothetical protein